MSRVATLLPSTRSRNPSYCAPYLLLGSRTWAWVATTSTQVSRGMRALIPFSYFRYRMSVLSLLLSAARFFEYPFVFKNSSSAAGWWNILMCLKVQQFFLRDASFEWGWETCLPLLFLLPEWCLIFGANWCWSVPLCSCSFVTSLVPSKLVWVLQLRVWLVAWLVGEPGSPDAICSVRLPRIQRFTVCGLVEEDLLLGQQNAPWKKKVL
jgi:hypothetical protein